MGIRKWHLVLIFAAVIGPFVNCQIPATNTKDVSSKESASVPFDCGRPSLDELCFNNGTCYHDNGTCQCPEGYMGYDCYYNEDQIAIDCPVDCQNGGTCLLNSDNDTMCYCTEAYYGEQCEKKRVYHQCSHDRMAIHITPPTGFLGWVYVLDHEEDPACLFDQEMSDTFTKELKFDSCGSATEETNANGDTLKSFSVIVQFDEMIVTEKDLEFEFVCLLPKSGSEIDDNILPFESSNSNRPFKKQEVVEELNPIVITLTTVDGQPITTPQVLGTEVKLNFKLNGGELYDNFRIEEIVVTNGQVNPKRQEVNLLADGCVPRRAFAVTNFGGDPADEMALTFRVFKLRYSDSLHFETKVKLCKGDGCNATDCSDQAAYRTGLPGLGRRKRDLGSVDDLDDIPQSVDDGKTLTYRAELKVWYPRTWIKSSEAPKEVTLPVFLRDGQFFDRSPQTKSPSDNCLQKPGFFFVGVGLVSAVLVLLVIIILIMLIRLRHSKHSGGSDLTYSSK